MSKCVDVEHILDLLRRTDRADLVLLGLKMVEDVIRAAQAGEVASVRRGTWVHDGLDNPHGVDWMHCSMCGSRKPYVPAALTKFCPHCGAQMSIDELSNGKDD